MSGNHQPLPRSSANVAPEFLSLHDLPWDETVRDTVSHDPQLSSELCRLLRRWRIVSQQFQRAQIERSRLIDGEACLAPEVVSPTVAEPSTAAPMEPCHCSPWKCPVDVPMRNIYVGTLSAYRQFLLGCCLRVAEDGLPHAVLTPRAFDTAVSALFPEICGACWTGPEMRMRRRVYQAIRQDRIAYSNQLDEWQRRLSLVGGTLQITDHENRVLYRALQANIDCLVTAVRDRR